MKILALYNEELDRLGAKHRDLALHAIESGDERKYTIHLMQAGMAGDMLRTLGRVQHEGARPGYIENILASLEKEEREQKQAGDYDMADRARVKAQTIRQAMTLLERLEKENA